MAVKSRRKAQAALPAYMSLSWDREKLHAFVTFVSAKGHKIGSRLLGEVMAVLESAGLKNVDKGAVSAALKDGTVGEPVLVAQGTPPKAGADGYIYYKVKVDTGTLELAEDEHDRINYRELRLFENVREGDVLAVLMDPQPGTPGVDVFGYPIPPEAGKPARLKVGRNVELDSDEKTARALIDGMPCKVDDRIQVLRVYQVKGDVNYATGNIRFVGDVCIGGSVLEGFVVEAEDNVYIDRSIEKARVTAGKDISVGWAIVGKEDVIVSAGNNLTVKFANNANLVAGSKIKIEGEVLRCTCEADVIVVEGQKSSVKGGVHHAYSGMKLSQVGDPRSTVATKLMIRPDKDVVKRLPVLVEQIEKTRAQAKDKSDMMRRVRNATENWIEKSGKELAEWRAQEKELEEELQQLQTKVDHAKQGEITVTGHVYPGTAVAIWDAELEIKHALHDVTFRYKRGVIEYNHGN